MGPADRRTTRRRRWPSLRRSAAARRSSGEEAPVPVRFSCESALSFMNLESTLSVLFRSSSACRSRSVLLGAPLAKSRRAWSNCTFRTSAGSSNVMESLPARGDPDRAAQILTTLLDNAVRHTPGGGTINISGHRLDNGVEVSVRDMGPGIPPEHLPRIFDRFYRVEEARTREGGGGRARPLHRPGSGPRSGWRPLGGERSGKGRVRGWSHIPLEFASSVRLDASQSYSHRRERYYGNRSPCC